MTDAGSSDLRRLIDRLPAGVNYEGVKAFLMGLPALPPTLLANPHGQAEEPVAAAFRRKSYLALDRELNRRWAALHDQKDPASDEQRRYLSGVRQQMVFQLLAEVTWTQQWKWITATHRGPSTRGARGDPAETTRQSLVLEVWESRRGRATVLQRATVAATAPPWGDPTIDWFDADRVSAAALELMRRHFPDVLRRRPGRWRTERPDPASWPLVTRYAIPWLYEYLRPWYPTRRYRQRSTVTPGHYPLQLFRDIADILRLERPDLAHTLTSRRVQARVQDYLKHMKGTAVKGPT